MTNLAIFASGEGTNAENIIEHFKNDSRVRIKLIVTNNDKAGVIARAERHKKNIHIISKKSLENSNAAFTEFLKVENIDLIVLAGFLLKVPEQLIKAFPDRIINIHPSLLPKFGGKGMYGHHVHEAVIAAGEKKSGITVHFVNEEYDKGKIILQAECEVKPYDTPDSLSARVRKLEFESLPKAIESLL